jgi:hypothetical protein
VYQEHVQLLGEESTKCRTIWDGQFERHLNDLREVVFSLLTLKPLQRRHDYLLVERQEIDGVLKVGSGLDKAEEFANFSLSQPVDVIDYDENLASGLEQSS